MCVCVYVCSAVMWDKSNVSYVTVWIRVMCGMNTYFLDLKEYCRLYTS